MSPATPKRGRKGIWGKHVIELRELLTQGRGISANWKRVLVFLKIILTGKLKVEISRWKEGSGKSGPQRYACPNLWNLQMLFYMSEKDFACVVRLRVLR